jgi:potassium-transporting ATPase KdpC subunit
MRALFASLVAIVVSTVVLGFAYPALMTGFAQVAMSHQANGSLIERNGRVVGSSLAAQDFTASRYFHERPSATAPVYNAAFTTSPTSARPTPRSRSSSIRTLPRF